jgi:hypothetical protein
MSFIVLMAIVATGLVPATASAEKRNVTLAFTELAPQPVDGVKINGVTFSFVNGDATYNAFGPGSTVFIQDPSLEGSASGTLTLTFARPTSQLAFGVAVSSFETLARGATVALYNPGGRLRSVVDVATSPLVSFTEGRFSYSGGAIGSAVVTFNNTAAGIVGRFALDNLTFEQKGVPPRQGAGPSASRSTAWPA